MFCPKCGVELKEGTAFCPYCGTTVPKTAPEETGFSTQTASPVTTTPPAQTGSSGLSTAAKVFMIIGTGGTVGNLMYSFSSSGSSVPSVLLVLLGFLPLVWCLPMTIYYFKTTNRHLPVPTGFKVCTLLFVNVLAGIFMLTDKNH